MVVSSGLQKYFDSQQKKKSAGDMQARFKDLGGSIDPSFLQSFEVFHEKIMSIVDENPEAADMISGEVQSLGSEISDLQNTHNAERSAMLSKLI